VSLGRVWVVARERAHRFKAEVPGYHEVKVSQKLSRKVNCNLRLGVQVLQFEWVLQGSVCWKLGPQCGDIKWSGSRCKSSGGWNSLRVETHKFLCENDTYHWFVVYYPALVVLIFFFFLMLLGFKLKVSHLLGRCSTT
jgi:hypothetical protein